jgi:hypothetical protein
MRRFLVVLAALAVVTAPVPVASAAPTLACNSGSAPQMRDGGRADWYTMNGYLTCNVDPRTAGVTSITRELGYHSVALGKYVSLGVQQASVQQTQAWSRSKYLYTWDTYTPRETVTLRGSFRYYAVPGCGRVDSSTVRCVWKGPQYKIVDLERGCGAFELGVQQPAGQYDYPVQDVRLCYYVTKNGNGNVNTAVSLVPLDPRATCTEEFHLQVYRSGGGNNVGNVDYGCSDKAPYYLTISGRFSYASVSYFDGGGASYPKTVVKSQMTGTERDPS